MAVSKKQLAKEIRIANCHLPIANLKFAT